MAKKSTKSKVKAAFSEVYANEPKVVAKTRAKKGAAAAKRQKVAIALSKARAAGAKVPKKPAKSPAKVPRYWQSKKRKY